MTVYLAMDMGTTNTRLWLCKGNTILDRRKAPLGAGLGKTEGRATLLARLRAVILDLLQSNGCSEDAVECILTSGMSGSEMALCEIPHVSLPSDLSSVAMSVCERRIPELTAIPIRFVPGLKKTANGRLCDLMRGEETELIGILSALPAGQACTILLPGTHNKIIRIGEHGEILDFATTLSGELLDMAVTKSILSGAVSHDFTISETGVLRGAAYAAEHGLNAALFHVRVMEKNGRPTDALSSFLCGAILREDCPLICRYAGTSPIFIGGSQRLGRIYEILLEEHSATLLPQECTDAAVVCALQKIYAVSRAHLARERILGAIHSERLISILRAPDRETLIPAAEALYAGGIRLLEVTFDRSGKIAPDQIGEMIACLNQNFDGRMLVGAGTVTSPEEVLIAFEAGASFIISPNCDAEIIALTRRLGMVSIPAAYTATEIAAALKHGADYIKLFPADRVTGGYLKAICAPLSDAKLLAVGGVTAENAKAFLDMGFYGVGVGSNLYNKQLINARDYRSLKELAKKYVAAIKDVAPI